MKNLKSRKLQLVFLLAVTAVIALSLPAAAQDAPDDPDQARLRLRERLTECIEHDGGLTDPQRLRMREHLAQGLAAGLDAADLETLFGEGELTRLQAAARLRIQERVVKAGSDDLPIEPVMNKLREGAMKGAGEQALENACQKMEQHVRTASRLMNRAVADGVEPPADPARTRSMIAATARNMWRGLAEGELEQLCEQARERARERDCSLDELSEAAETATRLREGGVERGQAMKLAGEALRDGYTVEQMTRLRNAFAAQAARGGDVERMAAEMRNCLEAGMGSGEMMQHMEQMGWMGPEHAMGHGPIDDMGGGPGDAAGQGSGGMDSGGGQGGSGGGRN